MPTKKSPDLLPGQIVVAPNTAQERIINVAVPRGKEGRRRMAKHYTKMSVLQRLADGNGDPSLGQVMAVISELWADDSFDTELMPMLLGIEKDKDAMLWYNGDGSAENPGLDPMEVFRAFTEAVAIVLTPQESEVLRDVQKK